MLETKPNGAEGTGQLRILSILVGNMAEFAICTIKYVRLDCNISCRPVSARAHVLSSAMPWQCLVAVSLECATLQLHCAYLCTSFVPYTRMPSPYIPISHQLQGRQVRLAPYANK